MPKLKRTADISNGANVGYEAQLWQMADARRGSMDAAEYKHVVLGLIFLKYISDAFEEQHTKLEAEKAQGADPEDPDKYRALSIFWVPPEARWPHLKAQAKQPTIGQLVDDAMAGIERDNPSLKGVLPKDYARPALDKQRLGQLIDMVSNIEVGDAESRSKDVIGRVYEYFLSQFASAEGKKGGEFYTPRCVVKLLVEMLEAMARALFQSWFVDFDAVRAKAEGRELGLPKEVADLFPDHFEDSELGEIPAGWEVGCVDDEFELTMGQSPPGETYNQVGEGLPFYQGRTDFGLRSPTRRVYCTAPTRMARAGDTLISVRAPVGDINMASEDCAIGRGVAAARHKAGSRSYSYQFMRGLHEVFARFEAEGTVFGSIGKKEFHAIPCVMPPRDVVVGFETMLSHVDSRIEGTERESRTLAARRDTLLPKTHLRRAAGAGRAAVCCRSGQHGRGGQWRSVNR